MSALLRLMALGRSQAGWLILGLLSSLTATLLAVGLSGAAGVVFVGASAMAAPMPSAPRCPRPRRTGC